MTTKQTHRTEAQQVLQLLKKHNIQVDQLEIFLTLGKQQVEQIQKDLEEDQYAYTNQHYQVFDDLPF